MSELDDVPEEMQVALLIMAGNATLKAINNG